jgi:hypothetical protein
MVELLNKKITVDEFREMEFSENDTSIYELIEGILMKKQVPSPLHQNVVISISHA